MEDEAFDEANIMGYYPNMNKLIVASVRRGLWEGMFNRNVQHLYNYNNII